LKLYRLAQHGSLDHLTLVGEPAPAAAPDEVLVRMRAASLNARDLMVILGPSPYGPKPGLIPLSDGAGEVVAIGSAVTGWAEGDRVVLPFRPGWIDGPLEPQMIATDLGGAVDGVLAEYVAVKARALVRLPEGVTFEAAAALPCAGVTAWNAIHQGAAPLAGDVVLVQGTGGVSIFALQIAKALECRVIATTSSDAKAERLLALGADHVVNYRDLPDWDTAVLDLTGAKGATRIVEVGGAGTLPRSMACLAPQGEIALVGLLDDPTNTISPLPLMRGMGVLRGISVGSRAHLADLVAFMDGRFEPVIDRVFGFDEAAEALGHLAARRHFGKVVLRI
jgi:NADPH:quinone reductase-like Zn-dependent oxidoreductase